jgi:hypothetical protein
MFKANWNVSVRVQDWKSKNHPGYTYRITDKNQVFSNYYFQATNPKAMSRNLLTISLLLFVPGFLVAKNRESLINGIKAPMFHAPDDVSYLGINNFQYRLNSDLPNSEHVGFSTNSDACHFSSRRCLSNSDRFGLEKGPWRRGPSNDVMNIVSVMVGTSRQLFGISHERLYSPNFGLEASLRILGIAFGIAAGANVYLPAIEPGKLAFRAGLNYGMMAYLFGYEENFAQIPIGITYLTRNNLVLGVDAGPLWTNQGGIKLGLSVKIGKAF